MQLYQNGRGRFGWRKKPRDGRKLDVIPGILEGRHLRKIGIPGVVEYGEQPQLTVVHQVSVCRDQSDIDMSAKQRCGCRGGSLEWHMLELRAGCFGHASKCKMSAAHCASCTVSEWGAGFGGFDQVVKGLVWGRSFYQHAVIEIGIVEDRRKVGNRIEIGRASCRERVCQYV